MHDALIQIISYAAALVFDVVLIARLHTILCYILDHRIFPVKEIFTGISWSQKSSLTASSPERLQMLAGTVTTIFPMTTCDTALCLHVPNNYVWWYSVSVWSSWVPCIRIWSKALKMTWDTISSSIWKPYLVKCYLPYQFVIHLWCKSML